MAQKHDWNRNELTAYFRKTALELGMESQLVRTMNALLRGGIDTMEKLSEADEEQIYRIRNMGEKSAAFALTVRNKYLQGG